MSSMRNAVQRRNHRERGQPEERLKWGLLEKHKDYSARARDYNVKKSKLKALRQKVLEKNPDEFYFGMMSRMGPSSGKRSTGMVAGNRGNEVLSVEAVRLFKTQDMGYVRTARNRAAKEVEVLDMAMKGIKADGRKIVFVDDVVEQRERVLEREGDLAGVEVETPMEERRQRWQAKEAEKREARLGIARERLKALTDAERALDLQRAKMAKSPTVGGVNKHRVKLKVRDRKR